MVATTFRQKKFRVPDLHFFADPDPDLGKNLHADPDPGGIRGGSSSSSSIFDPDQV